MSSLSPLEILHNAFRETLHYRGKYALVPQFLSNAEGYLKGGVIAQPSAFSERFFYIPPNERFPNTVCPPHTCMDYPAMECPACTFPLRHIKRSA